MACQTRRLRGQREEEAIGLYYYGARWYDATRGRFIQPDTIVPEPGNPQALDRYAYALNNPVKYSDPTGHTVAEFLEGIAAQWAYANAPMASALAVKADEPRDMLMGRVVGSAVATAQGLLEMSAGGGVAAGGGLLTLGSPLTGPGVLIAAPAGAAAAAAGATLVVHGGAVALSGAATVGAPAAMLIRGQGGSGETHGSLRNLGVRMPLDRIQDERTFVSWTQGLEDLMKSDDTLVLTKQQADELVGLADEYGVAVKLEPGHENTGWDSSHLHFGDARVHVRVPDYYQLPE